MAQQTSTEYATWTVDPVEGDIASITGKATLRNVLSERTTVVDFTILFGGEPTTVTAWVPTDQLQGWENFSALRVHGYETAGAYHVTKAEVL